MTTFNVSGTAERYSAPERAVVHIQVMMDSLNKGEPYRTVVSIHNSLVALAELFNSSKAATNLDASAPSTYSHQERWLPDGDDSEPQTRMRYAASSRVSVKFQDFEQMGEWLAELADQDFVSTSVKWELTEETKKKIQKEIRSEAVANARELAEDYARGDILAGNDTELELVSISDNSVLNSSFNSPLRSAMAGSSAPKAEMSPEYIMLSASITAVFKRTVSTF